MKSSMNPSKRAREQEEEELPSSTTSSAAAAKRAAAKTVKSGKTTAAKKPRAKAKGKREDGMPDRPLSAYNYFFREERTRYLHEPKKELAPGESRFCAMGKEIATRWKQLPSDAAKKFREMAAKDMERYRREMDEYHSASAHMKRLLRENAKPAPQGPQVDRASGPQLTSASLLDVSSNRHVPAQIVIPSVHQNESLDAGVGDLLALAAQTREFAKKPPSGVAQAPFQQNEQVPSLGIDTRMLENQAQAFNRDTGNLSLVEQIQRSFAAESLLLNPSTISSRFQVDGYHVDATGLPRGSALSGGLDLSALGQVPSQPPLGFSGMSPDLLRVMLGQGNTGNQATPSLEGTLGSNPLSAALLGGSITQQVTAQQQLLERYQLLQLLNQSHEHASVPSDMSLLSSAASAREDSSYQAIQQLFQLLQDQQARPGGESDAPGGGRLP